MSSQTDHTLTSAEMAGLSRKYTFFSWSVQKDVKAIPAVGGKGFTTGMPTATDTLIFLRSS